MATFDDLIRKIENLETEILNLSGKKITILPDANGMIDRECPKAECNSHFKVNSDDWQMKVKKEEAFCPFCHNNSEAQDYLPQHQREEILKSIRRSIMDNWKYGTPILHNIIRLESQEEFELKIVCENCNMRFSVIGAAYFCPCCGHNSIEKTATNSLEKIMLQAEKIDYIRKSLEQNFNRNEAVFLSKKILENSLSDCLGTLQSFSESKYNKLSGTKAPFNAFQNVEKGNRLWIQLKGKGYLNWLSKEEYKDLLIYTQRRHLITHTSGIADAKYLEITKDKTYNLGDRIIVNKRDIVALIQIINKIIESINKL